MCQFVIFPTSFRTKILFELWYCAPFNGIKMGFVFTGYFFCRYVKDAYFILALANCSPYLNKIIRYNMLKVQFWICARYFIYGQMIWCQVMDTDASWLWNDLAFLTIATLSWWLCTCELPWTQYNIIKKDLDTYYITH